MYRSKSKKKRGDATSMLRVLNAYLSDDINESGSNPRQHRKNEQSDTPVRSEDGEQHDDINRRVCEASIEFIAQRSAGDVSEEWVGGGSGEQKDDCCGCDMTGTGGAWGGTLGTEKKEDEGSNHEGGEEDPDVGDDDIDEAEGVDDVFSGDATGAALGERGIEGLIGHVE